MGKRRSGRSRSRGSVPHRLAREIYDRLERLDNELLKRRSEPPEPAVLDLQIQAHLHGAERDKAIRRFAASLLNALEDRIAEKLASTSPLQPGRVYCYWCDAANCSHAAPPAPRTVFSGYGPTGLPIWEDFVSVCLRLHDTRIDLLHRNPPRPFTVFMTGATLNRDQLPVFGRKSRTFQILCQALVGYLPFGGGDSPGKVAVTVQVVETRKPRRASRLALNLVGKTEKGDDFCQAVTTLYDRRLADLVEKGERRLRELNSRRPSAERDREIAGLVRHLAAGIEKICRQENRRTKHARLRHRDPSRPAGAALRDAAKAGEADFLQDRRRRTYVVLGPHCRAHVFNEQGQHVTSLVYRGEELERRLQFKQWIRLDHGDRERLRVKILGLGESERQAR